MRKMKDSGVVWIGEVPCLWDVCKAKFLMQLPVQTGAGSPAMEYNPAEIRYIRISDFDSHGNIDDSKKASLPKEIGEKYLLSDNDVLVATAGGTVGKAMLFHDIGEPCAYAGYLARYVTNPQKLDSRYLLYYLQSPLFTNFRACAILKATIENISASKYANMEVIVPPLELQKKIVLHFDAIFSQVDTLIANVQSQIEKLKSYKQSLITEVVTKGLDSTAPMKYSGVEWIGSIPAHWEIKRGKSLFHETDARSADGSEELLTVSQYTGITPRSQKNVSMFEALSLEGYKICEIGDIAANTMWLWAGAIGVSEYYGVISPSYNVYRQRGNDFVPRYLDHLLRAPILVQEYASLSTGIRASRLRLYPKDFFNISFPVPPLDEQQTILDFLNSKFTVVDQLISIKQTKIEKLEQYKRSLIYEYVTGKQEVS